ncbi:hypothetical protein GGR58DRAFT_464034 [Xylaria digitata]|nr:hypothetical protein GGR58DRAFT_464034 [Xylaria digitata]
MDQMERTNRIEKRNWLRKRAFERRWGSVQQSIPHIVFQSPRRKRFEGAALECSKKVAFEWLVREQIDILVCESRNEEKEQEMLGREVVEILDEERPSAMANSKKLELPNQKLLPEDVGHTSNYETRRKPHDAHKIPPDLPRQPPRLHQLPLRSPSKSQKSPNLAPHAHSRASELDKKVRGNDKLRRFRVNFIEQCARLNEVTKDPSTRLYQISQGPHSYRRVWASAITTMRQLSRLESRPSLMDALYFLCVSRAVAETDENKRIAYVSAFNEGLEQWRMMFPEIEDVARLMWGITLESNPQPRPMTEQNEMLQLREAVAVLIGDANSMFDLGASDARDEMEASSDCHQRFSRSTNHDSLHEDLSGQLPNSREKEPPGRLICPAITSLLEKTDGTPLFVIVTLVTTIIFALVVYFMLGFAHITSPMVLGFPNPWYTIIPQITSTYQSTSYDVSFSSYTETANPSLLSRPSSPFNSFRPNFDVASSPIPVLD